MMRLPDGQKSLMIDLAVSTQFRHVTDGRTDGQADILRQHSPRYA